MNIRPLFGDHNYAVQVIQPALQTDDSKSTESLHNCDEDIGCTHSSQEYNAVPAHQCTSYASTGVQTDVCLDDISDYSTQDLKSKQQLQRKLFLQGVLKDDASCKFYTGLTLSIYTILFSWVSKKAEKLNYWRGQDTTEATKVEASLTNDPDNEDLLKLKRDLQEVIDLTSELIGNQKTVGGASEVEAGPSNEDGQEMEVSKHEWKSGDPCMALWSEDRQYYQAAVDEILEDGTCTVKFDGYDLTDVTEVRFLKQIDPETMLTNEDGSKKTKSKKDLIAQQREYKRKKSQKKAQRLKQMEEERESEKNKWLDFNSKTFSKTNKGKVKKSIFATPDHVNGKVGVGTCGIGGRPMTQFVHQEKWKK